MPQYGFSLTRIFPYKDRIVDEDRDNVWKESESMLRQGNCILNINSKSEQPSKTEFNSFVPNAPFRYSLKTFFRG